MRLSFPIGLLAFTTGLSTVASAQNLDTVRVASGLVKPDTVTAPPIDLHRIFITEQWSGKIRILKSGTLLGTPFLNLGPAPGLNKLKAAPLSYAQGLLGLAFHPDYVSNGYFYVYYTNSSGNTVVERYTKSTGNPDVADASSGLIILGPIVQPGGDHQGGCMRFGPDGMLYIATGDGSSISPSTPANGQDGSTLLGKMLRLDVDLPPPYLPQTNPYVSDPLVLDEIWDFGLRSPWQFSFDRDTGDMYIGDVGKDTREEVNIEPAPSTGAKNYGWNCMEGFICTGAATCTCNDPSLTLPVTDYTHSFGCAIIGGHVYRGCAIPLLEGQYIYGDHCSARIFSFTYDRVLGTIGPVIERTSELAPGGGLAIDSISAFGEDGSGEMYIVDYWGGEVFKIVNADPLVDCNSNQVADSCDIAAGNSLDVNGNGIPDECECAVPLSYCTAKLNSLGCLPTIGSTGVASASAGNGFVVDCVNVRNQKSGLLFYGVSGQAANSFQGGTLCVKAPVRRTPATVSGGSLPPAADCTGVYGIDMNAFAVGTLGGTPLSALTIPGTVVDCQWWGRDPGFPAPLNTQLSNGLEYTVCL